LPVLVILKRFKSDFLIDLCLGDYHYKSSHTSLKIVFNLDREELIDDFQELVDFIFSDMGHGFFPTVQHHFNQDFIVLF